MEKLSSLIARLFFAGAFVLLVLAVVERIANGFGYTITTGFYHAGRLLEFAVVLLVFVVALLLREIREELKRRQA